MIKKALLTTLLVALVLVSVSPSAAQESEARNQGKEKFQNEMTWTNIEKNDNYERLSWQPSQEKEDWGGFLLKPKGNGPFPALIANHAGMMSADKLTRRMGRQFVARGFVVIGCDLGHRGKAQAWKNPGASEDNVHRVLTALTILHTLPYVDQQKLAMYGHSMGGFCTLGVLAEEKSSSICVAAISGSGIQVPGSQDSSRHIKQAAPNAQQAGRIQTPLLMIHADDDRTVPLANAQALKKVLDENKIPNKLILRKGVGHRGVAGGKRNNMEELIQFFETHFARQEGIRG